MTTIATWFVADGPGDRTFFPQVGTTSDAPETQAAYWRCTMCFYASSLAVNHHARHVFYTNTAVPSVDGVDLAKLLARWGVEVVTLPITWRLPRGTVRTWGNQFYVFDVIGHFVESAPSGRLILMDSDCLWLRSSSAMDAAIDRHGALTYQLGPEEHAAGSAINGLSREGMARFLTAHGGQQRPEIPYCGGEIFAADHAASGRILRRAKDLWPSVVAGGADAPREEAHLLSVAYALEGIETGTANAFIRRMWTTFHLNNLHEDDAGLTVWHLPAEKLTGFRELFDALMRKADFDPMNNSVAMGLTFPNYASAMGFPRRRPAKLVRDLALKVREKVGRVT